MAKAAAPNTDLIVDPEFADVLPKLKPEERADLKAAIERDGEVRDAVCYWANHGELLDGYNRKEIADELGFPLPTRAILGLDDRNACKLWILKNQGARRNETEAQRKCRIGQIYEIEKLVSSDNLKRGDDSPPPATDSSITPANSPIRHFGVSGKPDGKKTTAARIAADQGTSERGVVRSEEFLKAAREIKEKSQALHDLVMADKINEKDVFVISEAGFRELDAVASAEKPKKAASELAKKMKPGPCPDGKKGKAAPPPPPADEEPQEPPAAPEILDGRKEPVPDNLRTVFSSLNPFQEAIKACGVIQRYIKTIVDDENINRYLGSKGVDKVVLKDLRNVKSGIKDCMPFAPCPYCAGKNKHCEACVGQGWVSEPVFDSAPKEMK